MLGVVTLTLQPKESRRERYALATYTVLTVGLLLVYLGLSMEPEVLFS